MNTTDIAKDVENALKKFTSSKPSYKALSSLNGSKAAAGGKKPSEADAFKNQVMDQIKGTKDRQKNTRNTANQ